MNETATIAKAVRADMRAAIKTGDIELPEGAKVSIRSDQFSLGASVDVTVVADPERWAFTCDTDNRTLSPAARRVGEQIERILRKHLTWQWGGVYASTTPGGGLVLGSVAPRSWAPGQD